MARSLLSAFVFYNIVGRENLFSRFSSCLRTGTELPIWGRNRSRRASASGLLGHSCEPLPVTSHRERFIIRALICHVNDARAPLRCTPSRVILVTPAMNSRRAKLALPPGAPRGAPADCAPHTHTSRQREGMKKPSKNKTTHAKTPRRERPPWRQRRHSLRDLAGLRLGSRCFCFFTPSDGRDVRVTRQLTSRLATLAHGAKCVLRLPLLRLAWDAVGADGVRPGAARRYLVRAGGSVMRGMTLPLSADWCEAVITCMTW